MRKQVTLNVGVIVAVLGAALVAACGGSEQDIAVDVDAEQAALTSQQLCGTTTPPGPIRGIFCTGDQICCTTTTRWCGVACPVCTSPYAGPVTCTSNFDMVYPPSGNTRWQCNAACADIGLESGELVVTPPTGAPGYGGAVTFKPGRTLCVCK